MNATQILTWLIAVVCLVAAIVLINRARTKAKSRRGEALRKNLRLKVMYDEAKIDRLIEFEADELKRKHRPMEPVESLMERAIARWERDNAGTAPLY